MLIHINEPTTEITAEGRYDVVVTAVEEVESKFEDGKGFRFVMKTKDNRVISDTHWVKPTTIKFISRLANLVGMYDSPISTDSFIGKYFNINVVKHVNGNTTFRVSGYEKCAEPFTRTE